jgi:hypothetical protein
MIPIPAVGALASGVSNMGGSALGYFGQKGTNEANLQIARETSAFNAQEAAEARSFNAAEAQKARNWQETMSSTAYQRAMKDMRSAGLNPMLAFSQGGASSPGGAQASGPAASGVASRSENTLRYLGEGLASATSSAMGFMKDAKMLESADAGIAAQKAAALASVAQANNANANAKATEVGMPSVRERARSSAAEADAVIAKSRAQKATSDIDAKAAKYDGIMRRVLDAIGGVSDVIFMKRQLENMRNQERDRIIKEETHLRKQGSKGTRLP